MDNKERAFVEALRVGLAEDDGTHTARIDDLPEDPGVPASADDVVAEIRAVAPTEFQLEDTDWMRHRLPVSVRSLDKLRTHLAAIGLSIEAFKKLPMFTENLSKYPWLREL